MPTALACDDQFAALFGNRRGNKAQVARESGVSEDILHALEERPAPDEAPSEGLEIRPRLEMWCQKPRGEIDPLVLMVCHSIDEGETEWPLSEWLAWLIKGWKGDATLPLEWGRVVIRSKKGELERVQAWLHAQWYWRYHSLEGLPACPVALSLSRFS